MSDGETRNAYQGEVGRRLRAVRQQQDLTLQQVEERSEGKWKAVVIGAYERGDRAISAAKLVDLATFYGVPVSALLPETQEESPAAAMREDAPIVLDLNELERGRDDPTLAAIMRWALAIQSQRGDFNGRVLTIRRDDVRTLAIALGVAPDRFREELATRGVLASR